MTRFALAFLSSLLVTGCQVPFSPDSPLTPVPEQSTLVLHRALTIPPQNVSLWFQNGQQTLSNDLNRYYPHCKFETRELQAMKKIIQPDTFIIHKVVRWDDYARRHVQLAATRMRVGIGIGGSGAGPGHFNTATEMFLHSPRQPDVYRMVCSQWEDAGEANHVTINQIRRTLGDVFSLNLPLDRPIMKNMPTDPILQSHDQH